MMVLAAGLIVFIGVHLLPTMRPQRAALISRFGENGYKGLFSLVSLLGLVLIVWGYGIYRAGGYVPVWSPPRGMNHLAALLMWFSFVALAAAYLPSGKIKGMLKHPMLVAVKIWALAHLLSNGDLGSIFLFTALLAFAVYGRIAAKKRGDLGASAAPFGNGDIFALAVGSAAWLAMIWLHLRIIGVPIFS
ncbi:MAG: NnrU family protein [Alphaproteobacteria bacterium]|nr:NnrU family protein [Alphaproteobacteria bacterium]